MAGGAPHPPQGAPPGVHERSPRVRIATPRFRRPRPDPDPVKPPPTRPELLARGGRTRCGRQCQRRRLHLVLADLDLRFTPRLARAALTVAIAIIDGANDH